MIRQNIVFPVKIFSSSSFIVMGRARKKSGSGGYGNSRNLKTRVRVSVYEKSRVRAGIEISGIGYFSGRAL